MAEIITQFKEVLIEENGTSIVVPDPSTEGLAAFEQVKIITNVQTPIIGEELSITENGEYTAPAGIAYNKVIANVSGASEEELEAAKQEGIAEQKAKLTELRVTANGTYQKEDGYKKVVVDTPSANLQEKTLTFPSKGEVLPDEGFDGMSKLTIPLADPYGYYPEMREPQIVSTEYIYGPKGSEFTRDYVALAHAEDGGSVFTFGDYVKAPEVKVVAEGSTVSLHSYDDQYLSAGDLCHVPNTLETEGIYTKEDIELSQLDIYHNTQEISGNEAKCSMDLHTSTGSETVTITMTGGYSPNFIRPSYVNGSDSELLVGVSEPYVDIVNEISLPAVSLDVFADEQQVDWENHTVTPINEGFTYFQSYGTDIQSMGSTLEVWIQSLIDRAEDDPNDPSRKMVTFWDRYTLYIPKD